MATIFLEFISDALAKASLGKPGQTPHANTAQHARRVHQEMVRSWSSNRLRLFNIPEALYLMKPNQGSYTIGPDAGADFDTSAGANTKPVFIQAARVIVGTARRWPLNILTRPQWDIVQTRTVKDPDGPLDLFYDYAVKLATINVAPMPTTAQPLYISQWNALRSFAEDELDLDVEDFYPGEYIKPTMLGLAVELCQAYTRPVSQELLGLFQDAIGPIEKTNNDKLSGSFGFSRSLDGPLKGDGSPVSAQQGQQ